MKLSTTLSVCVASWTVLGAAYAQVTTASFYGNVADSSGAVIPSAAVTLTHEDTGATAAKISDTGGEFGFDFLRVGLYTLRIEAKGFKKFESRNMALPRARRYARPSRLRSAR